MKAWPDWWRGSKQAILVVRSPGTPTGDLPWGRLKLQMREWAPSECGVSWACRDDRSMLVRTESKPAFLSSQSSSGLPGGLGGSCRPFPELQLPTSSDFSRSRLSHHPSATVRGQPTPHSARA